MWASASGFASRGLESSLAFGNSFSPDGSGRDELFYLFVPAVWAAHLGLGGKDQFLEVFMAFRAPKFMDGHAITSYFLQISFGQHKSILG